MAGAPLPLADGRGRGRGGGGGRLYFARGRRSADGAIVRRGAARARGDDARTRGDHAAAGRRGRGDRARLVARVAGWAELPAVVRGRHRDRRAARTPGGAAVGDQTRRTAVAPA